MMRILYTSLLYLIQPWVWLRLLWRSRKAPAYRQRWAERYGFCRGKVQPHGILIHAVSVGETVAAVPLIKALQARYPALPITVTTMTPTGSERVTSLLGDSVSHVYLPYDLPDALARFLSELQPTLAIIVETELWPNLIFALHKRRIPLVIANARLSARSAKGYANIAGFTRQILERIPVVAAQNPQDGERFVQLGLPTSHLAVTGSIKFDIDLTDQQREQIHQLRSTWPTDRPVLIAASTHVGEDELILRSVMQLHKQHPDLLLILVPRHPERFKDVEKLIASYRLTYQLRSAQTVPDNATQVILGDTMGELMQLYALATIAFVGGSLVARGGHNPLEPALHHLPIIMGEHTFNFRHICAQLSEAGGLATLPADSDALAALVDELLTHRQKAEAMGEHAYQILKQNQGALARLLAIINGLIEHETDH